MLLVLTLAGCRQDMHNQPKVLPLRQSDFFADQRTARTPVAGTVARGQLEEDAYFYSGMIAPNQPGDAIPFPVTEAVLQRGQERFNIYCSPCHSRVGDGNGMIVQRGYRHPPSFHTEQARAFPVGHFFDVMTHGFGAMPDYAAQVAPPDRWAIAAYIRVLQYSQHAPVADVPPAERGRIAGTPAQLPQAPAASSTGEQPGTQSAQPAPAQKPGGRR
ncbi:MAG TPA: cytochrome c [Terriglobales bacterium]|nr:cytochrome c [Terriglobales bacterium]